MLLEERFWAKVDKSGECWVWFGSRDRKGYGRVSVNQRPRLAHRVSWELSNGPIPDGLCVLHRCDNPPCCNPAHLFLGTIADNNADMASKGRHSRWPTKRTHCQAGHEYTPENTTRASDGTRRCLACLRAKNSRLSKRNRERNNARARELYQANLEESRRHGREKARLLRRRRGIKPHCPEEMGAEVA